eukprot:GHVN01104481.1.p1 GENE.GHVN01104481.1~~GHVN01104481.1.p1  ORF type:complete len:598 (-),score=106.91 GHVN01104481.1:215-2008(-)
MADGLSQLPSLLTIGRPSFKQVLNRLNKTWEDDRDKITSSADHLTQHISKQSGMLSDCTNTLVSEEMIQEALTNLSNEFDSKWGGFGEAPKFPQPMILEFILRGYMITRDLSMLHLVTHTLDKMAQGGFYDHIGGGFARYSTDARWLVPHFEKMLYDNSQLSRVYLHAWQLTMQPLYKKVVEEVLDFTLREMTHSSGGWYSSQDADSEGVEGKFYVWTRDEVDGILGVEDSTVFCTYYDITPEGNWEDKKNIPNMPKSHSEVMADLGGMDHQSLSETIERCKKKLYQVREQRIKPGLDNKVLTSWNGLMLASMAEAGRVLKRDDYTDAAVRNAEFLYSHMRQENGYLLRTWKEGHSAKLSGYLEDYSFLCDGLLSLYQTTFDNRWFKWADELGEMIVTHFIDEAPTNAQQVQLSDTSSPNSGESNHFGFYDTSNQHEVLIMRPKDIQDNAIPSGNASACHALLHLHLYTGKERYLHIAQTAVSAMANAMERYPTGFGQWLNAATLIVEENQLVAILGEPGTPDVKKLVQSALNEYNPFNVIAVGPPGGESSIVGRMMIGRGLVNDKPTAYVCRSFGCRSPTTDPSTLAEQLSRGGLS